MRRTLAWTTLALIAAAGSLGAAWGQVAPEGPDDGPVVAPVPAPRPVVDRVRRIATTAPAPGARVPASAPAAPPTAAEAPATIPAEDLARWQPTVTKLASEDFAERQAAQKELDKARMRDRPTLKALAEAATDAEVKARLLKRYEDIEEEAATNPPPISIDVKDAPLSTVVDALNKEMGVHFNSYNNGNGLYTLKAVDEPFWDVFMKLSQQSELMIQPYQGLQIMQSRPGIHVGLRSGSFLFIPQTVNYQQSVDLQRDAGQQVQPPTLSFTWAVAVDPRIKVASYSPDSLVSVVDDTGTEMLKQRFNGGINRTMISRGQMMFSQSVALESTNNAKKIASAKGVLHLTVVTAEQKIEIADMEKQGRTPITIAGRTLTVTRFQVQNGSVSMDATLSQTPAANRVNGADPLANSGVGLTLIDHEDRTVYTTTIMGGFGGGFGGQYKTPIRAVITVPLKVKAVEIPFEFKDLPLPVR
jgi:hypothetical protein